MYTLKALRIYKLKNTVYLLNISSNSNPLAIIGKEGEIF